ncbi:hypothetical protein BDA99DRAFT_275109 [Phascolomyces articulosus]|uniref:F-box domain-containing protein n=1 Tax=Phascolomyces articulosus TaxID=60185 RepID=A0AAD5KJA8_9FUNG|nr:hypothetical protein BDA99DRAFT_275109 [Phascolomyces articulosus]
MLSNDFSDKLELTTHVDCDNSDHIAGITQQPHEENYNDLVIKRTSPLLVELQSRIIHLLKLRMTAWAQRKRYDKELEDGKTLMIYAPQDPTGYLCVGRHYAYQGFQKQAIDTFSNGLKNIPITNIQYDALIKAKQQAEARQLNSFDILTRLSYDISCCVIDCLPQETVSECSRVSRTWRKLILEYPKVWRSISINSFNKKQALPLYMLLPYVSQHVEDLSLPCQESMDKVLNLVDENDFSNLRSLQLKRVILLYSGIWICR